MSEKTNIAWCDSTINFWIGCTKVLDHNGKLTESGCKECYADEMDKNRFSRTLGGGTKASPIRHWGKGVPRYKVSSAVRDALALNRKPWICDHCGNANANQKGVCECGGMVPEECHRRRIFSLSLADWLDDEVPIEWFAEMLDTIRQCDQVTWILCTKRPQNFFPLLQTVWRMTAHSNADLSVWLANWEMGFAIPENVILLTSVENQEMADKRIPELLKIPTAVHGLSLEPLLGSVGLQREIGAYEDGNNSPLRSSWLAKLKWVIVGGESGPNARPCDVDWIRSLVEQGQAAGIAVFVKQLGARPFQSPERDDATGHELSLKHPKGGDPAEWPEDLRVQQFPSSIN